MTGNVYACDFETTTYEGQEYTEVWLSAVASLSDTDDEVEVQGSMDDFFKWIKKQHKNMRLYYHNLKFDGEFLLAYLLRQSKYKSVTTLEGNVRKLKNNEYNYVISTKGQFYCMKINLGGKTIEIYNSYLLMPYSLKRIGESFKTKHKKLEMEYRGVRYANCPVSEEELRYIKNDVLVLKEALNIMFDAGHTRMSIGSCCLYEFKHMRSYDQRLYPDVYGIEVPEGIPYKTAGDYIHKSYYGGWTHLKKGEENKIHRNGFTIDANSLYPSVMHSKSGNRYPVGQPTFFTKEIPKFLNDKRYYYFVRINCSFRLKPNYLPFIQIKNSLYYRSTVNLETSDIYDYRYHKYYTHIQTENGIEPIRVNLTLTCVDFKRFLEFYYVDYEVLDGCYFATEIGIFDEYIEHYYKQKEVSKGAKREEAKLFLNNLYGQMAKSPDSSYKVAYLDDKGRVKYNLVKESKKKPGYIPIGSAITSYARDTTIRVAQRNYEGFIYADTDSYHGNKPIDELIGVVLHDSAICCWKHERSWDYGWFVRKKTYIEFNRWYQDMEIKCAGMPEQAKQNFINGLMGDMSGIPSMKGKPSISISDFKPGLKILGKLRPVRYPGGIVLEDCEYTMRAGD